MRSVVRAHGLPRQLGAMGNWTRRVARRLAVFGTALCLALGGVVQAAPADVRAHADGSKAGGRKPSPEALAARQNAASIASAASRALPCPTLYATPR